MCNKRKRPSLHATAVLMLCFPMAILSQTGGNTTPSQGPPPVSDPLGAIGQAVGSLWNGINSLLNPNGNNSSNSEPQVPASDPEAVNVYTWPDGQSFHAETGPGTVVTGGILEKIRR